MKRALAVRANKTADANSSSVHSSAKSVPVSVPVSVQSNPYVPSGGIGSEHIAKRTNSAPFRSATNTDSTYAESTTDKSSNNQNENKRLRNEPQSASVESDNGSSSVNPHRQQQHQQEQAPPQRGRKRKKEEQYPSSDEEDEEQSAKAYFLQFQNKALASELHMLKHKIRKLEQEETKWRTTGTKIQKGVEILEREWRRSVASICGVLYSVGFLRQKKSLQLGHADTKQLQKQSNTSNTTNNNIENEDIIADSPDALLNTIMRIMSGLEKPKLKDAVDTEVNVANAEGETGGKVDLENLQSLISSVHTMSDHAEISLKEGLINWMKAVGLRTLAPDDHYNEAIHDKSDASLPGMIKIEDLMNISHLHQQISFLKQRFDTHQERIKELEIERNDAMNAEKRVRRGLYRIASGRLKIEEVMKDVENEDNGHPPLQELEGEQISSTTPPEVVSSDNTTMSADKSPSNKDDSNVSTEMKQKIKELETRCDFKDKRIKELIEEEVNLQKRINDLISTPSNGNTTNINMTSEQIRQTDVFVDIAAKLATAEAKIVSLNETIEDIRRQWGISKGECEHAKKMLGDLNEKHAKRWMALVNANSDRIENKDDDNPKLKESPSLQNQGRNIDQQKEIGESEPNHSVLIFSKEITRLEHKLGHAVEAVRQVEAIKQALLEATKLNDCLQSQVSEWKSKYTSLSSSKSRSSSSSQKASGSSSSTSEKASTSTKSEASIDRLKMDFRKCRKELLAEKLARDNYKAKNERLEKERDSMMRTNVRLIKQSSEKEEMNTKSLSQILQLNHLSELHTQEIETLQQKLKAVEQVALTARLASNAKARVNEETKKEKEALEKQVEKLTLELGKMKGEKEKTQVYLNQSKNQLQEAVKDLEKVRTRCNELASGSSSIEKEKTDLMESLAVAKKEAKDSAKKANSIESVGRSRGNNGSSFTVEQLTTHLSVVKRRLACPVCNDREKQCILMRCRHMFCKHCVDENIKNRSRKCPACGQRFDTKDVADVWL